MRRQLFSISAATSVALGIAALVAAAEGSIHDASCNCSETAAPAAALALADVLAQAAANQPAAGAQPGAGAQPAAEAEPLRVAGQQFPSREAFVGQGRRCGTLEPTADELEIERSAVAAVRRVEGAARVLSRQTPGNVKVLFHVIHKGAEGRVTQEQIEKQVEVLNAAFMSADFTFELADVDYTDVEDNMDHASWFTMSHTEPPSPSELKAKEALVRDSDTTLNVYTANLRGGLLGWATFPSDLAVDPEELGYDPTIRDGVVILHTSLPLDNGMPNPAGGPYGAGHTLTHEVGHYLGLYHTFQGGCFPPGDEVDDTPAHTRNLGPCPEGAQPPDTCLGDEFKDPVKNFMNYTDDACMNEFTPNQVIRMHEQCGVFRPKFFEIDADLREEIQAAARAASR